MMPQGGVWSINMGTPGCCILSLLILELHSNFPSSVYQRRIQGIFIHTNHPMDGWKSTLKMG